MENFTDFQLDFSPILESPEVSSSSDVQNSPDTNRFEEIIQQNKKSYRCLAPACGKIFRFKSDMTRHIIVHVDNRPYLCNYGECKKAFKRPDALENHQRLHTGIQPYECPFSDCKKTFPTKAALRYHETKHNKDRDFKCELPNCNKSFITINQLKQHQRISNCHWNWLAVTEENPRKLIKNYSNITVEETEEINKHWNNLQFNEQDKCKDEFDGYTQEEFQGVIKFILQENKFLREKIKEQKGRLESFQNNKYPENSVSLPGDEAGLSNYFLVKDYDLPYFVGERKNLNQGANFARDLFI